MAYKHGVYVSEAPTSLTVPTEGSAGLQVIFGTAAIYKAEKLENATEPKLIYSYDEAVKQLGYSDDFDKFTLCESMKACFDMFAVAPIILVNVLDPNSSTHATKVSSESYTAVDDVFTVENAYTIKSSIEISGLVRDTDYTVEFDSEEKAKITLVSATAKGKTTGTISYKYLNISGERTAVTETEIINAINKVKEVYPRFNMTAGLLLAPGWSHKADVATKLQAACTGINGVYTAECILDISTNTSDDVNATAYTAVKTAKENLGASSEHAIACWPMVKSGSNKLHMSAVMGALIAYTDADNGDVPNLSPSNKSFKITGTCLADGTEVIIDQNEGNVINSFGACTAINMNGYKAWGNNTCAYPSSTDPKDRWIMVRRFFTWRSNSLILTYFQRVDDPANYRLIESIVDSENINGNSYVARGICAGYNVTFLSSENPITQILNGQIVFHIDFAPFTPAENIEFILEFDPTAIETALTGGE